MSVPKTAAKIGGNLFTLRTHYESIIIQYEQYGQKYFISTETLKEYLNKTHFTAKVVPKKSKTWLELEEENK